MIIIYPLYIRQSKNSLTDKDLWSLTCAQERQYSVYAKIYVYLWKKRTSSWLTFSIFWDRIIPNKTNICLKKIKIFSYKIHIFCMSQYSWIQALQYDVNTRIWDISFWWEFRMEKYPQTKKEKNAPRYRSRKWLYHTNITQICRENLLYRALSLISGNSTKKMIYSCRKSWKRKIWCGDNF